MTFDSNGRGDATGHVALVCGADTQQSMTGAHLHRHQHDLCQWALCSSASDRRGANAAGDDGVLLLPVTLLLYHRFALTQLTIADTNVIAEGHSSRSVVASYPSYGSPVD